MCFSHILAVVARKSLLFILLMDKIKDQKKNFGKRYFC